MIAYNVDVDISHLSIVKSVNNILVVLRNLKLVKYLYSVVVRVLNSVVVRVLNSVVMRGFKLRRSEGFKLRILFATLDYSYERNVVFSLIKRFTRTFIL